MNWAIFKNGRQISKAYPHKIQAVIDAFERKLVCYSHGKIWLNATIRRV